MKRQLVTVLVVGLVFVALVCLPLLVGVWLPDVLINQEHVLAEQRLASGYLFRVVQYWNHSDFYSTQLRVTSPDGHTTTNTLDGDDSKSWRLPLTVDEEHHTAIVTLGGNRVKKVDW